MSEIWKVLEHVGLFGVLFTPNSDLWPLFMLLLATSQTDLLIQGIYRGIFRGKLDQKRARFEILDSIGGFFFLVHAPPALFKWIVAGVMFLSV